MDGALSADGGGSARTAKHTQDIGRLYEQLRQRVGKQVRLRPLPVPFTLNDLRTALQEVLEHPASGASELARKVADLLQMAVCRVGADDRRAELERHARALRLAKHYLSDRPREVKRTQPGAAYKLRHAVSLTWLVFPGDPDPGRHGSRREATPVVGGKTLDAWLEKNHEFEAFPAHAKQWKARRAREGQ